MAYTRYNGCYSSLTQGKIKIGTTKTWVGNSSTIKELLTTDGGTITGNLRLKGSGNYGNKLNFGDGDYVYLTEPTDDNLEIKAKNINLVVSGAVQINGTAISSGGGTSCVFGTYTGTGNDLTQTITLGFRAKAVLITPRGGVQLDNWYIFAQIALDGYPSTGINITSTGFTVLDTMNMLPNEASNYYAGRNPYRYIAFK